MRFALPLLVLLAACGGDKQGTGGTGGVIDPSKCKPVAAGCDPACISTTTLGPDDSGSEGLFEAGAAALALSDGTSLVAEERWTPAVPRGLLLVHAAADGHTLAEAELGPGASPRLARIGSRTVIGYAAPDGTSLVLGSVAGVKITPLGTFDASGAGTAIESLQEAKGDILVSAGSGSATAVAWLGPDGKSGTPWFSFARTSSLPAAVVPSSGGALVIYEDGAAQKLMSVQVTRTGTFSEPAELTGGTRFGPISAVPAGTGFLVVTSKQLGSSFKLSILRLDASGKLVKEVSPAGGISQVVLTADGFHTGAGWFALAPGDDKTTGPASVMLIWRVDPNLATNLPPPARLPLGLGRLLAFDASGGDYDLMAMNGGGPVRVHGIHCYAP